ncbi:tRNA (cytosine(38)-C(5))-methyltransferase-like isoform X2 [Xenia sp. Carnegie-2017]|uniref:tRNA (cytosine(38)-C(5))-methyltransferase-like isoform X2 n=1 Tax=Xenia sp. Carnegie-2017 TaxID=2897299 RepID=UPI001F04C9F0|nr:tRNA (cytosine(38)-C(5))-methyltransferase-like isoform X2 [Xenia sp. Carnegie-2017]
MPTIHTGKQNASSDPRTKSFLHILRIIKKLPLPPTFIFLENVKGFEVSETRDELIQTLKETNYSFQEFLLTPSQFGIPNSRLRYFIFAVHEPFKLPFKLNKSIMKNLPRFEDLANNEVTSKNPRANCRLCNKQCLGSLSSKVVLKKLDERNHEGNIVEREISDHSINSDIGCTGTDKNNDETKTRKDITETKSCNDYEIKIIEDYLEDEKINHHDFLLPQKVLMKKVLLMDIVQKHCNHSCCFTKGYGHYVEGTGSVLQMTTMDSSKLFLEYKQKTEKDRVDILAPLGLRYFTPREIANILCFSSKFEFPSHITRKQRYRLLGNSVNVLVVRELMKLLFSSQHD